MFCTSCGVEIVQSSHFCQECGNPIKNIVSTTSTAVDLDNLTQTNTDSFNTEIDSKKNHPPPPTVIPDDSYEETSDSKKISIGSFEIDKRIFGGFIVFILIFSAYVLTPDEEEIDLYIQFNVMCSNCEGPISADIESMIPGSVDYVIGYPDDEGHVKWEYSYTLPASESDSLLWASIIATNSDGEDRFMATFISVDDEPTNGQSCLIDSDYDISQAIGSWNYFTYDGYVNQCSD